MFEKNPFRRPDPIDNFDQVYLGNLQKQYKDAPVLSKTAWGNVVHTEDSQSVSTAHTTANSSDEMEELIASFCKDMEIMQKELSDTKSLAEKNSAGVNKAIGGELCLLIICRHFVSFSLNAIFSRPCNCS